MCVHERAEACKWSIGPKGEKAFMLYGDARQVGLVCVQLDAEMSVAVTHYEPSNLPGFNGSTDPTPLRLLLFILTAQDEDLGQIMSLMQGFEARRVTGVSQESGEQEEWEVATSLGQGGFGYVCALKKKSSDDQMTFPVIKSLVLPENFSRLENERIVLLSLLSCRCQSIPLCVDALQVSTLGSRVCALKLSARGVAIPKYLRSVQVKQETAFEGHISSLVRALGPSIVEALKFAHEKMICHCDVRPPNLIIVPPPATMAQIEKHEGDMAEFVVISRIDVSAENGCYFLLNDWGEAELFRSKTVQFENQKKKDLQSLVKALASPEHLMTGSNVSSGSSPASRPENGYQRFFLNALVIKNLSDLAQSLNYDALSAAFKRGPAASNPGHTSSIVGLGTEAEAAPIELLEALHHHTQQERFRYEHRWQDNDLVLWDNRQVQHRATGCPEEFPRMLIRTTVLNDQAPVERRQSATPEN